MLKKTSHLVFLALAIVGVLYVVHMYCNHQGQSIFPSFGTK